MRLRPALPHSALALLLLTITSAADAAAQVSREEAGALGAHLRDSPTWSVDRCDLPKTDARIAVGEARRGQLAMSDACVPERGGAGIFYYGGGVYRLDLGATAPLAITASSTDFPTGVAVHDSTGTLLMQTIDADQTYSDQLRPSKQRLELTLPAGTYYLAIGHGTDPLRAGLDEKRRRRFELKVERLAVELSGPGGPCSIAAARSDSLVGDTEVTGRIDVTGCFRENGGYGRWYRLRVPTRRTVAVQATSTDFPVELELLDVNGAYVAADYDSTVARVEEELSAGVYYVALAAAGREKRTGAYTLAVRTVGKASADSALPSGAVCTGKGEWLTPGEEYREFMLTPESCRAENGMLYHGYTFEMAQTDTVMISHAHIDGSVDPMLIVADSAGQGLASTDEGGFRKGDAQVILLLPAGRYILYALNQNVGQGGRAKVRVRVF